MTQTTDIMRPRGVEPQANKYQLHWKKGEVDIVCCVCDVNKQLTEILTAGNKIVSHTYCQQHFKEEIESITSLQ